MIGEFENSEESLCVISQMEALAWFEPIAHLKIVDFGIKVDHAFVALPQSVWRSAVPRATIAVHLSEVSNCRTKCRVKL